MLLLAGCGAFDESLVDSSAAGGVDPAMGARNGVLGEGDPSTHAEPDPSTPSDPSGRNASPPDAEGSRAPESPNVAPADGGAVSPAPCMPASTTSYCDQLTALPAAPQIDGVLDCGPLLQPLAPVGWNGAGEPPADVAAQLAVATRPDGLYVYVEVHGRQPVPHPSGMIHCGDAVELYVDADGAVGADGGYSTPGTIQIIVAAPSPAAPGTLEALRFVAGSDHGPWSGGRVQTALLPDGYAVEGFVVASDLGLAQWAPAGRVGLDVAIDVSAPASTPDLRCGVLSGQYFLRVNTAGATIDDDDAGACNGEPWCDSRAFCTPAVP